MHPNRVRQQRHFDPKCRVAPIAAVTFYSMTPSNGRRPITKERAMFRTRPLLSILLLCAATRSAGADEVARLSALAKMPVKEITVFKDGHAFVLHEGKMPTDAQGDVQMDYLPTPVIGTFWPYSADKNVKLQAVTASPRRVLVERTALTIPDLLEANPGADVNITQTDGKTYSAQIVGVPTRNDAEQEATDLEHSTGKLPEKGALLLVKSGEGTSVLPFDHIRDVTFRGPYKKTLGFEEFRNLLTLKLEWPGGRAAKTADVGMVYLQKGVRWIPSYKVTLDGKGGASIALEATMINEMTDLNDVTANLVIGVPSFFFQGTLDPISLQQSFAQLSPYFQNGSQTGFAMSNSLMSQTARMGDQGEPGPAGPAGPGIGPAVAGSKQDEDLFVFTVKHVTLKKGQRMVLPIAEYSLKYQDIYAIDLPYAPPREMRASNNSAQQEDLARLMSAPKAQHKIRMLNNGKFPLTTAPALI